jgi:hypothetical protein
MDADTQERLEKYEAHVRMLEDDLRQLATHRGWIRFIPFGVALAPIGLLFSGWIALAIAGAFVLLAAVAGYLNASRTWYARKELERTRSEVEKLRHGDPDRDPARELRFWNRRKSEPFLDMLERRRSRA